MQNCLPKMLTLPTKFNIFNLHHQRIQTLIIDKHTQAIERFFEDEKPLVFTPLSTESFWQGLKTKTQGTSGHSHIEALHQTWLKLMPLVHLSSKQLIQLYQDHVISLERCYQYLVAQFPEEEIKRQLTENLQRISLLKKHIFDGLHFRAQIYQTLPERNVDDVLAAFSGKLQALGVSELSSARPLQATLDDDRRLFVFDLLRLHGFNETDLYNEILSPLPNRPHRTLKNKGLKRDLEKFNAYRNSVLVALRLQGIGEYVFAISYPSIRVGVKRMGIALWKRTKRKFNAWRALAFWEQIKKVRFLIYLALSFSISQCLERLFAPLAFSLFSVNATTLISSFLFYGVALAPIWWQGFQVLHRLCGWIQDYVTCWKKREILDALIVLEDTEHFLCEKLGHTILDLRHFDTQELNTRVAEVIKDLDKAKMQLGRYAPGEKWACASIAHEAKKAMNKIILLKGTLKKRLSLLASHVAIRAGEEMDLLEPLRKEQARPLISRKQLSGLAHFVNQSGDKTAQRLFAENTNVTARWLERVKTDQFLFQKKKYTQEKKQPWGGYEVRRDTLKGWEIILNAFVSDSIEKQMIIKLHYFLLGKVYLTEAELSRMIPYLGQAQSMLEGIQAFVFKTLPERPPACAALLSTAQKNLISAWYLGHQREIDAAKREINKIFYNGELSLQQLDIFLRETQETLCDYFSLLDGEDIYHHAVGKQNQTTQNKIRTFFEGYDGSNSDAYRLINFIPKNEQATWLVCFAEKRLSWLLEHVENAVHEPFTENDIALFHNLDLYKKQFDFSDFVQKSLCFNTPWSKKMEQFLLSCQAYGFDTGELASRYSERKSAPKAVVFKRERANACNKENISTELKIKRKPVYA